LVAILEDMKKRGLFATSRGAWSLTVPVKDIDIDVPETLQGMLEAQIAQLSPAERRVLESACVAGERFSPWTIAPTLDMTSDELEQICEELSRHSQFIRSLTVREPGEFAVLTCVRIPSLLVSAGSVPRAEWDCAIQNSSRHW
jgi:hypothetical protein